jgi:hypothetical protein
MFQYHFAIGGKNPPVPSAKMTAAIRGSIENSP